MCGFVGVVGPRGGAVDPLVLAKMTDLQAHRGPDDRGFLFFDVASSAEFSDAPRSAAVGFRRLSIQDLSAAGHQPMMSESQRRGIVFNGEIYNAPQLRQDMQAAGVRFRGTSDTEVVLKLYELAGERFIDSLNGMFALALIDLDAGRVLLARDRIGIKPLYYTRVGETLLFGSELKSFFAFPGFRAQLDESQLDEYVRFRYCTGERTLLNNVFQLKPGHAMHVSASGVSEQRRYWQLPDGTTSSTPLQRATEELEDALERSVRSQLLADVDVGCQLSGGIDSSLVNLLAARNTSAGMAAFSVTLRDPRFSEAPWIEAAAQKANVDAHCYELNPADFVDELDRASWHLDQPINHPNSLGLLFLTRHASQHVKVLLSGEGADEIMGGYPRFFHARLRKLVAPILPMLRVAPGVGTVVERRLGSRGVDAAAFWVEASARLSNKRAAQLLGRPVRHDAIAARRAQFEATPGVDYVTKCMNYETSTYLVDLLIRQDKMTMAHSVENRVPFLDHELIETVRRVFPSRALVGGGVAASGIARKTKRPLKLLSEKYFGADFTYRPKSGFAIPLQEFFQHDRMRTRIEDELLPHIRKRGIFSGDAVSDIWKRIGTAGAAELDMLWSMFSFELWAHAFLDARA